MVLHRLFRTFSVGVLVEKEKKWGGSLFVAYNSYGRSVFL